MYECLDQSHGDVIGYEIAGDLTEAEFEEVLEEVEETIIEEGSVRLLVYVPEFPSIDFDLIDEDIGFWLTHGDDIERYAVVGDSTLMEWAVEFEDRLSDIDMEYFEEDELGDAWEWIDE